MALQTLKYHFAKAFQGIGFGTVLTVGALTTVVTGMGVYEMQEADYDIIGGENRIEQVTTLENQLKDLTILKKTADIASILATSNPTELKTIIGSSALENIHMDTQTTKDNLFNRTIDFQYGLHKYADIAESDYAILGKTFNALGLNKDWNIPIEEAKFLDENRLETTATNKFDKIHDLEEMRDGVKANSDHMIGNSVGASLIYALIFFVGCAFADLENAQGSRRLNKWAADKPKKKNTHKLN